MKCESRKILLSIVVLCSLTRLVCSTNQTTIRIIPIQLGNNETKTHERLVVPVTITTTVKTDPPVEPLTVTVTPLPIELNVSRRGTYRPSNATAEPLRARQTKRNPQDYNDGKGNYHITNNYNSNSLHPSASNGNVNEIQPLNINPRVFNATRPQQRGKPQPLPASSGKIVESPPPRMFKSSFRAPLHNQVQTVPTQATQTRNGQALNAQPRNGQALNVRVQNAEAPTTGKSLANFLYKSEIHYPSYRNNLYPPVITYGEYVNAIPAPPVLVATKDLPLRHFQQRVVHVPIVVTLPPPPVTSKPEPPKPKIQKPIKSVKQAANDEEEDEEDEEDEKKDRRDRKRSKVSDDEDRRDRKRIKASRDDDDDRRSRQRSKASDDDNDDDGDDDKRSRQRSKASDDDDDDDDDRRSRQRSKASDDDDDDDDNRRDRKRSKISHSDEDDDRRRSKASQDDDDDEDEEEEEEESEEKPRYRSTPRPRPRSRSRSPNVIRSSRYENRAPRYRFAYDDGKSKSYDDSTFDDAWQRYGYGKKDDDYSEEDGGSYESSETQIQPQKIELLPEIKEEIASQTELTTEKIIREMRQVMSGQLNNSKPKVRANSDSVTSQTARSEAQKIPPQSNAEGPDVDLKYFQYFNNFGNGIHTAGGRSGNDNHYVEQHEIAHKPLGLFQKKVRWADKEGGFGEHYWDLNH